MEKIRSMVSLEPEEYIEQIHEMIRNVLTSGPYEGWNGYFVITSKRLLFYKKNGRDFQLIIQLYMRDIDDISWGGNIMRHIIINGNKFFPKNLLSRTIAKSIESIVQNNKSEISNINPQTVQKIYNQESEHSILCSHCGFQNDIDAIFCSKCGSEL
ncbi:MAG TPA: zinc ribbon domain-containing protein [Candidatus Deferrimicrobium sp.]|nr:zinc ribbon domain-containing protein [Candidatus Deferrimicrobium sp.]